MASAETSARSRLSLLNRTADEHRATIAELDEKLAAMPARIEKARIEALRQSPTKRSDGLNSEPQKLRRDEMELRRERDNLADELAAVLVLREEVKDAGRVEALAEVTAKAAELDQVERAAWVQFAEAFESLVRSYVGVLDVVDSRLAFAAGMQWENDADRVACEPLLRSTYQQPFPVDLLRATEMALDASADPHNWGVHGEGGGVEVRLGHLVEIMPDLRGVYRHGTLTGGAGHNQTTSNKQALAGAQPLGSFSAPLPARGFDQG